MTDLSAQPLVEGRWFFSAPDELASSRQGDPLGLRRITDEAAELVAPGISYATVDARWISILSWALVHSDRAYRGAIGEPDLDTATGRRRRYEWLQPLELLWIARAVDQEQRSGYRASQWPGANGLRRWSHRDGEFGLRPEQRERYRQIGIYAAYRVILRNEAFTSGDGWTPVGTARALAGLVDGRLGDDRPVRTPNGKSSRHPARWWVFSGWPGWRAQQKSAFLPSPRGAPTPLPAAEARLIRAALFPDESPRTRAVKALFRARHAKSAQALAESVGRALSDETPALVRLGALARLSESGRQAMLGIARVVAHEARSAGEVARDRAVERALSRFRNASVAWLKKTGATPFDAHDQADRLAQVGISRDPKRLVVSLVEHHEQHRSGRLWLHLAGGRLRAPGESVTEASTYGYRFEPLARLAVQAGVAKASQVPRVLELPDEADREEES